MKNQADKDAKNNPLLGMFGAMQSTAGAGGNLVSEEMGAQEAAQMKELPNDGTVGQEEVWAKLGFELGEPGEDGDEIFRPVKKAPPGWRLERDRRDGRHMNLLDEAGRKRGSMFVKNAYYDRKANIGLNRRFSITYRTIVHGTDYDDPAGIGFAVVDQEHTVYETHHAVCFEFCEPMKEGEERWTYSDRARDACAAWLREHYPDFNDPTAYWGDKVESTRVEKKAR